MKNITILTFSSRKNGNCIQIAEFIKQFHASINVRLFAIDQNSVQPCNNCDYECLRPSAACPSMAMPYQKIMDAVIQSDLTYFIVPNYCGYPCANYFAFNERSVGYFDGDRERMERYMNSPKRFIIVSNTEGSVFEDAMHQQTNDTPQILYLKTRKYQKQSIAGDLLSSMDAKADLEAFLHGDYK